MPIAVAPVGRPEGRQKFANVSTLLMTKNSLLWYYSQAHFPVGSTNPIGSMRFL